MGSKGRVPPHVRRPIPGHPMMHHPEQFGLGVHPPPGPFPFDMLPPPELMEQKLAAQHSDMQRLATENQRLAATHSVLRQELARAQQELQRLQANVGAMKTDNDHQMRGLLDKIAKMEVDLQAAEAVKLELQQAQADAQSLAAARQELIAKVQHLAQDLQRSHVDNQEIPALMSELEGLKQEYQHCRATYDYEKKLYNDHLESLQVMEKNYVSMARELEKLRAELANKGSSGHQYGGATGYKEDAQHTVGQNPYEDGYGVSQGRGHQMGGNASYGGVPSAPAAALAANPHGPGYDASGGRSNYDAARGVAGYNEARGAAGYDAARGGPGYNAPRGGGGYDVARGGPGYSAPRGDSGYEVPRGSGYDAQLSRGAGGPQAAIAPGNTAPYGSSATPSGAVGGGYEAPPRGTSAGRR